MLAKLRKRLLLSTMSHRPDHHFVVVAARRQHMLIMRTPSEATDLLSVTKELLDIAVWCPHISDKNRLVLAATCNDVMVGPRESTDPVRMSRHLSDHPLLLDVPDLNFAIVGANREVGASVLAPADGGHLVAATQVYKIVDFGRVSVPSVHVGPESYCEDVALRPINEIEVEIVTQAWSVQDFIWLLAHPAFPIDQNVVS